MGRRHVARLWVIALALMIASLNHATARFRRARCCSPSSYSAGRQWIQSLNTSGNAIYQAPMYDSRLGLIWKRVGQAQEWRTGGSCLRMG